LETLGVRGGFVGWERGRKLPGAAGTINAPHGEPGGMSGVCTRKHRPGAETFKTSRGSNRVTKITFTDRARDMVRSFLAQDESELEALRIAVSTAGGSPDFDLTLVRRDERESDEVELAGDGFAVLVRSADEERLDGATVDYVDRVNESGFEVNLAQAAPAGRPVEPPTGDIADRVRSVLDSQVNPAIAAHGGVISLVDVQDKDIYVEMSGGCQGCALSRMTLRQGVERMLREAVPELAVVHDVTDHESGENPYL